MEKNKWLTAAELMDRWGINRPTLGSYIEKGTILSYSLSDFEWCSMYVRPSGISSKYFIESEHGGWRLQKIVQNLDDLIFRPEDVVEFEKNHPSIIEAKELDKKIEPKKEIIVRKKVDRGENYFVRDGGFWKIGFEGRDLSPLKHSPGLQYIHYLLQRPNEEISSSALTRVNEPISTPDSGPIDGLRKTNLNSACGQMVMDERTRSRDENVRFSIQSQIVELENKIKQSNDPEEKPKLEEKLRLFRDELRQFEGEGQLDKPRVAVTMAIKRAIEKIKEYHPDLAKYLDKTIKTGVDCYYHSLVEKPIQWNL